MRGLTRLGVALMLSCSLLLRTTLGFAAEAGGYQLQTNVSIPLRDGVKLAATLYRPRDANSRHPVLFTLTPYSADSYHERPAFFARNGYAFLLIDSRGRGNSGGKFDPLRQEANDAHDVVEWLHKQPFSNGQVSMWGGSYAGYNQWMAASKQPDGLFSIVPVASPYPALDFPTNRNVGYPYLMRWLTLTSGALSQNNLFGDDAFWSASALPTYRGERPYAELDQIVGNPLKIFQEWIKHPHPDAYWDAFVPTDAEMAAIDLPILSITGTYDGDQPGALEFYRRHMSLAPAQAKSKHYLLIGPWDHAGTRTPRKKVGGLTFGDASLLDLNQLHLQWYQFARGLGARPKLLASQVTFYITGAETWRSADSLDAVTQARTTLYLGSPGINPDRAFRSGDLLASADANSGVDHFSYDPLDFRRADIEAADKNGDLSSQRIALSINGDGLVYMSDAVKAPTILSGRPSAALYLSTDVPDTDISMVLYEITAAGNSVLLSYDTVRLRYRESLRQVKPYTPGQIEKVEFKGFTFFAHQLAVGSRLRLLITAPNSPTVQKNFNSGGIVALETAKDARIATINIHLDKDHPSQLSLPMGVQDN